jgi:hypothetical protein
MGIQGLLSLLKPTGEQVYLGNFKNQTAVVDIMTWLYKGVYSC